MLFFPYRADINLARWPIITCLICLLCIGVFYKQLDSEQNFAVQAHLFCKDKHERIFWVSLKKITGNAKVETCVSLFQEIYNSSDSDVYMRDLVAKTGRMAGLTQEYSARYMLTVLHDKFEKFKMAMPQDVTRMMVYYPDSYQLSSMVTAAFAHGSWGHLLGNLFFFFAFAALVEVVLGSIRYIIAILVLAIGTHLFYSLAMVGSSEMIPTLGLSGVVMGMMGLFTYFIPAGKIRCILWIVFYLKRLFVPAWVLAAWYIGWDIYNLITDDGNAGVNFVAHVSGAAIGVLLGVSLFRAEKKRMITELKANSLR